MSFNCLLCNDDGYVVVKDKVRDSNEYKIVKCKNCGHVQINPLPSIGEDQEYYEKDLQLEEIHKNLNIQKIRDKVRNEMVRRKNDIQGIISKQSRMLEVGSGYGVFLEIMQKEGYQIEGIEISKKRREVSRGFCSVPIHDINLLGGTIPEVMCEKYDVVVLFHVLEHISDPTYFLSQINKMLKSGGKIVIEVPNRNDHMLNISKEYNDFFWLRAHVSYFSKEILEKMICDNQYINVQVKGTQRYSIKNNMNWIINEGPQIEAPTFELEGGLSWIDKYYKEELCKAYKSDTLLVFAEKV